MAVIEVDNLTNRLGDALVATPLGAFGMNEEGDGDDAG